VRFCEGLGVQFPGPTRHGQKGSDRAYLVRITSESRAGEREPAVLVPRLQPTTSRYAKHDRANVSGLPPGADDALGVAAPT
jgi:hypothetical protein